MTSLHKKIGLSVLGVIFSLFVLYQIILFSRTLPFSEVVSGLGYLDCSVYHYEIPYETGEESFRFFCSYKGSPNGYGATKKKLVKEFSQLQSNRDIKVIYMSIEKSSSKKNDCFIITPLGTSEFTIKPKDKIDHCY